MHTIRWPVGRGHCNSAIPGALSYIRLLGASGTAAYSKPRQGIFARNPRLTRQLVCADTAISREELARRCVHFRYCPHPVTVYIRGPIKRCIYPYYIHYPTVTGWGQYPTYTLQSGISSSNNTDHNHPHCKVENQTSISCCTLDTLMLSLLALKDYNGTQCCMNKCSGSFAIALRSRPSALNSKVFNAK